MMTKNLYWKIGGYDEELSGNYGTSGRYRARAFKVAEGNKRLSIDEAVKILESKLSHITQIVYFIRIIFKNMALCSQ